MGHRGDLPACGKGCVGIPLSSSRYFFISEDVLHSKDGVKRVEIHALSCSIPSLFPFFLFVIVIKKICSLLNHFPVRK